MKKLAIIILLLTTTKVISPNGQIVYEDVLPEVTIQMDTPQYLKDFLHAMGQRESSNRYDIVNTLGYMGKYQFGMSTLETLRIKTTQENFLKNPSLQEYAMKRLLKRNKELLQVIIKDFSGTIIDDVTITESGILAAAHLGGAGSVIDYFLSYKDKSDNYGTKVSHYMKDFSGYRLELN